MSLLQLSSILRARWGVVLFILLSTIGAAAAWALLRPTFYTARAPVLVDVQAQEVGGGYSPALIASYMATQMDIARSERVAQRARELLKDDAVLTRGLEPTDRAAAGTGGDDAVRQAQVRKLQTTLEVKPARESNIINIAWTGTSPAEAARVANTYARAYVDVALDIRTGPAKQEAVWLDEQVQMARGKLQQAQTLLSQFQQRAGITSTDERVDAELARLNELSTQLTLVQTQTTDSSARRGTSGDTMAEVIQSPLVNNLKAEVARLEGRMQDAAATMGPAHPQMQRMEAEVTSLRARLRTETSRIASSIEATYQAGK